MSRVTENCGIQALSGITEIKSVSMYTIINIARDNGINFYFCRVEVKDLPLVKRPAIFHSDDHFTLVQDGRALPHEDYSGWVLTPKPFGTPLPFSLAKQITGGKKGGVMRTILPTVIGFASNLIIPGSGLITGALSNIGMDQYAKSNHPEQLGKAGNPLDILGAGAVGALSGAASQGAISGFKGAASGFGNKAFGALSGAVTGASHPIASNPLFGSNSASMFGGGAGQLASQVGGFNKGTPSVMNSNVGSSSLQGLGATNTASGAGNIASQIPKIAATTAIGGMGQGSGQQQGGGNNPLSSIFGGDMGGTLLKTGGALLASQLKPPPTYNPDSGANFDKAKKYLGDSTLPNVTNQQLNKYLTMSISDIKNELTNPAAGNRATLELDKKYQQALTDVQRAAANSGQDINTSSDARKQYDEVNRQWAEAKANIQNEMDQQATTKAVEIHQWALTNSIQQGQFDTKSAMELAANMGLDQKLKYSIEQQDYQTFQDIVAHLLNPQGSGGQQQQQKQNLPSEMGQAAYA